MQLYNGAFPPPTSHPLHPLYAGLVVHGDGDYTDSHAFRQRWAQPAGMSGRQKLALLSLTSPLVAAFALRTTFGIIFLCFLKTFSLCLFFFSIPPLCSALLRLSSNSCPKIPTAPPFSCNPSAIPRPRSERRSGGSRRGKPQFQIPPSSYSSSSFAYEREGIPRRRNIKAAALGTARDSHRSQRGNVHMKWPGRRRVGAARRTVSRIGIAMQ